MTNEIIFVWVSGHTSVKENAMVDELARMGSKHPFIYIRPFCGNSVSAIRTSASHMWRGYVSATGKPHRVPGQGHGKTKGTIGY